MKQLTFKFCVVMTAIISFVIQSCDKHSDAVSSINQYALDTAEINLQNQWICTNENLPSLYLQEKFESLNLSFKTDDSSFHWTWKEKNGFVHDYIGTFIHSKSTYKNDNLQDIWNIQMVLQTYNGAAAIGGWRGIYSSSVDAKTLMLNVEVDDIKTIKFPTDYEGLGSGMSANNSVFAFKKVR